MVRRVRQILGSASLVVGLLLAGRASFVAAEHDYVLTLACALAAFATFRVGVELLAAEVAE